jgi:hypothetical protein
MIDLKTWFVLGLLLTAPEAARLVELGDYSFSSIMVAFIYGFLAGGFWALLAKWVRNKFFQSLPDSYLQKILLALIFVSLLLYGSIILEVLKR